MKSRAKQLFNFNWEEPGKEYRIYQDGYDYVFSLYIRGVDEMLESSDEEDELNGYFSVRVNTCEAENSILIEMGDRSPHIWKADFARRIKRPRKSK